MQTAYWVVAALLGLLSLYAGGRKIVQTREQPAPLMEWVDSTPMWLVRPDRSGGHCGLVGHGLI